MADGRPTQDIARDYEERLAYYLGITEKLPVWGGKVNAKKVAEACGFDRRILYGNQKCREMLEQAAARQGIVSIKAENRTSLTSVQPMDPMEQALKRAEQRAQYAEKRMAILTAECVRLRAEIERLKSKEVLIAAGGRFSS